MSFQQNPNYDNAPISTGNAAFARRITRNISFSALLCYILAACLFVGFFVYQLPRMSSIDTFVSIAVFFGGIAFFALVALYDWYWRKRSARADWLMNILVVIVGVAYIASFFFTSNTVINDAVKSFIAGCIVVMVVSFPHRER